MRPIKTILAVSLAALISLPAALQAADDESLTAGRRGLSLGGRAAWFEPDDARAGNGHVFGGAQLRVHATRVLALEASADYRQQKFQTTTADIYPVQASLLAYLAPDWRASPFLLAGAGWYFTRVRGPGGFDETSNRFGPHVGAGLEIVLTEHWSIDGTYRYAWIDDVRSRDGALQADYKDRGHQGTVGINLRF